MAEGDKSNVAQTSLFRQKLRRRPDIHSVNLGTQGGMEVGAAQGQQEFRSSGQGGNQHRSVLCFFEDERFVERNDIRNQIDSWFNDSLPGLQTFRAESRQIAKRFVSAVAGGDQIPAMFGTSFADMPGCPLFRPAGRKQHAGVEK